MQKYKDIKLEIHAVKQSVPMPETTTGEGGGQPGTAGEDAKCGEECRKERGQTEKGKRHKKRDAIVRISFESVLVVLAFSSSFRLFLTLYAWLLIVLSLADLLLDTCLCTVSLETT